MQSHDHNFKYVFLDFPRKALTWLLPETLQEQGDCAILNLSLSNHENEVNGLWI